MMKVIYLQGKVLSISNQAAWGPWLEFQLLYWPQCKPYLKGQFHKILNLSNFCIKHLSPSTTKLREQKNFLFSVLHQILQKQGAKEVEKNLNT